MNLLYSDMPTTDNEVLDRLNSLSDDWLIQKNVIGIYSGRRGMGYSLLDSFAYALECLAGKPHLPPHEPVGDPVRIDTIGTTPAELAKLPTTMGLASWIKNHKYQLDERQPTTEEELFNPPPSPPLTMDELNRLLLELAGPSKESDKMFTFCHYLPSIVATLAQERDRLEDE